MGSASYTHPHPPALWGTRRSQRAVLSFPEITQAKNSKLPNANMPNANMPNANMPNANMPNAPVLPLPNANMPNFILSLS
ncbi:MAG: hypothetical protein F6J93_12230 [Oscillatoria sp. SIO1A7]|nr:hypothetical protein [Oscillatoria sp. SIO1A7]